VTRVNQLSFTGRLLVIGVRVVARVREEALVRARVGPEPEHTQLEHRERAARVVLRVFDQKYVRKRGPEVRAVNRGALRAVDVAASRAEGLRGVPARGHRLAYRQEPLPRTRRARTRPEDPGLELLPHLVEAVRIEDPARVDEAVELERVIVDAADVVFRQILPVLRVAVRDELESLRKVLNNLLEAVLVEPVARIVPFDLGVAQILRLAAELTDPGLDNNGAALARAVEYLEPADVQYLRTRCP